MEQLPDAKKLMTPKINLHQAICGIITSIQDLPNQGENVQDIVKELVAIKNRESIGLDRDPNVLDLLSECLVRPEWTVVVSRWVRPLLLDLVGRWKLHRVFGSRSPLKRGVAEMETSGDVEDGKGDLEAEDECKEKWNENVYVAFSVLLPLAPQLKR
jgi:hypothetical protein